MELCSKDHDEICYEGRDCPACALKDKLEYFVKENDKLMDLVYSLNEQLNAETGE
jgi:Zn ribbon nucleic-acid-binding protein